MEHSKRQKSTWPRGMSAARGYALAAALLLGLAGAAVADDTEVRDYAVQVDGKSVGSNQLVITDRADGSTVVSNRSNVQVRMLITYTFSYEGTEVWQKNRLLRLDARCNDNRKQYAVNAALDNNALRLRVNDTERVVPVESWSTSYWKLPESKYFNQAIPVVDAGKGEFINGKLDYLGTEQRAVNGQPQNLYHFRVTGGRSPVDLWYDAQHRLVRREFMALGHRTVMELVGIRR